jgi:hypothetical protein
MVSDMSSSGTEPGSPTFLDELALGPAFVLRESGSSSSDFGLLPPLEEKENQGRGANTNTGASEFGARLSPNDSPRRSRDLRELVELRESLRRSTSSLRSSTRSNLRESQSSTLRESTRASNFNLRESTRSRHGHSHSMSHGTAHHSYNNPRERRDSQYKDPILHPTHGTRVVVSAYERDVEDRFLDFDDI